MDPYDPAIQTGVNFDLNDVNYTTDQGEYSLLIKYGEPDIATPITLDVQGIFIWESWFKFMEGSVILHSFIAG